MEVTDYMYQEKKEEEESPASNIAQMNKYNDVRTVVKDQRKTICSDQ